MASRWCWSGFPWWSRLVVCAFLSLGPFAAAASAQVPWWSECWSYRAKITVNTGAAAVSSGYSVRLTFDHAALTTAKSLASGDDVRILHWNGASWTELDRALDPLSAWDTATATVWFRLVDPIAASSSDDAYYLYYGNPWAPNPPDEWANVFVMGDDFDDGTLTSGVTTSVGGAATISETGGELALSGGTVVADAGITVATDPLVASKQFAIRNKVKVVSGAGPTGPEAKMIGIVDSAAQPTVADTGVEHVRRSIIVHHRTFDDGIRILYFDDVGGAYHWDGAAWSATPLQWTYLPLDTYFIYDMVSDGTSWQIVVSDAAGTVLTTTTPVAWASTQNLGFDLWFYFGEVYTDYYWADEKSDWVFLRDYVSPEPTAALAAEEPLPTCPCSSGTNYRSIGTNTATLYATGDASITAGQTSVTFGSGASLPGNIGRGDKLTIGTETFYIQGRASSTQVVVQSAAAATHTNEGYAISRVYSALPCWEAARQGDLVGEDRRELGVAYNDASFTNGVTIDGSTTDATHYMWLTVALGERHNGIAGTGVVLDGGGTIQTMLIRDDYTRVEWFESRNHKGADGHVISVGAQNVLLSELIVHDFDDGVMSTNIDGISIQSGGGAFDLTVRNSIVYDGEDGCIQGDQADDTVTIENCTLYDCRRGVHEQGGSTINIRNTISMGNSTIDFNWTVGALSNNLSEDGSPPAAPTPIGSPANQFVNLTAGSEDFHLKLGADAIDTGANLSASFVLDIDGEMRQVPWDIGADDYAGTTAVTLQSFSATPLDSAVDLSWVTASELENLGFHLDRSLSETGPWDRITASLIPGLGSSPVGASYSWRDTGLVNGVRYFYRLEDVDTSSVSTFHGPVWAVPQADLGEGAGDTGEGSDDTGEGGGDTGEDSGWEDEGSGEDTTDPSSASGALPACTTPPDVLPCVETYGDPSASTWRVVRRRRHFAMVELVTPGFEAIHETDGRVRVNIPGFEDPEDPHAPALPFKRVVLDGAVGKGARIAWARERGVKRYPDLEPEAAGFREMELRPDGTVRAVRKAASLRERRGWVFPKRRARLGAVSFVGESKEQALELYPVRWDVSGGGVRLSTRLRVRVEFVGREAKERGKGSRGRRNPRRRPGSGKTLAFLHTTSRGLYGASFEALFPGQSRALRVDLLSLKRQGESVAFHVEPEGSGFGPGSVLYFWADQAPRSTSYEEEVAFELVRGTGGKTMARANAAPGGELLTTASFGRAEFETNRIYQAGLLEAQDLWQWENLPGGVSKSKSFDLSGVDTTSPRLGQLRVWLQGASDTEGVVDHHVEVLLNGTFVGDVVFAGKVPKRFEAEVPAGLFVEGGNELTVRNAGDTGVYSLVFLDRFGVDYPQTSAVRNGAFEGSWAQNGVAQVATTTPVWAVDVTDPTTPVWLAGVQAGAGTVSLRAEGGREYVLASPEGVLVPRASSPVATSLKDVATQADYILITPQAFVSAAQPLLDRRRSQGLRTQVATLEEIAGAFGHGEASGEAIQAFLTYAYQEWRRPSPRYVLLLGDGSHDPRNYLGTSGPAPLPALFLKTSYLVTASDPVLGAVNGEDLLPDVAIGRLPAQTVEQAQILVEKTLTWEDSGQGLGGTAVLVADNPDDGGDFEADVEDIHDSFLSERPTQTILLREEGAGTRTKILQAMDEGASLISYVGHGGAAVWASENVLNSWDVSSLQAQSEQAVMLTLNCLNGYFVAPSFESLGEAYLKAEGRGTVAAVSPSGLSVDGPAHELHKALVEQLTNGSHERLGDAVLAAQHAYAQTGQMPELLSIYHLLGDPGMAIR